MDHMTVLRKITAVMICAAFLMIPAAVWAEESPAPAAPEETPAALAETPDPADNPVSTPEPTPTPVPTPEPTPTPVPTATPVPPPKGSLFRVHQINIGCANAYLLTVDDLVMMVDCGTNTQTPIANRIPNHMLFDYLAGAGIDHIDVFFITHWHRDHCYNLNLLLETYGSDASVVYGPGATVNKELDPLSAGTYRQIIDGDRLTIGPLGVQCVGPEYREDLTGNRNPESLNLIFTYGETRFFFSGDWIDSSVRKRWGEEILQMDVLAFPHHGLEPLCMTKNVYRDMDPRLVLVPGQVRYTARNFAADSLGVRARDLDTVILTTADGNVLVSSDGSILWYAINVDPADLPLGDPLPARKER